MTTPAPWGADVPISMPQPLDRDTVVLRQLGGFCFTTGGIAHNFTTSDLDSYLTPVFQPRYDPAVYRA
jgi:hypothetical protein